MQKQRPFSQSPINGPQRLQDVHAGVVFSNLVASTFHVVLFNDRASRLSRRLGFNVRGRPCCTAPASRQDSILRSCKSATKQESEGLRADTPPPRLSCRGSRRSFLAAGLDARVWSGLAGPDCKDLFKNPATTNESRILCRQPVLCRPLYFQCSG